MNLEKVRDIEKSCGCLISFAYKIKNSGASEQEIEDFLKACGKSDVPSRAETVAEILLDILTPLRRAAVICADQKGNKSIDYDAARRFYLGVLQWEPHALWRQASLLDLAAAFEGYVQRFEQAQAMQTDQAAALRQLIEKEQQT